MSCRTHRLQALLLVWVAWADAAGAAPSYTRQPFELPAQAETLVVVDLDGDGHRELLTVIDQTLRIYLAGPEGFDFAAGFIDIDPGARAVGWDISTGFGNADQATLITLTEGRLAQAWPLENGALAKPITLADNLPGFIGRGMNRLRFARDINEDGEPDLVIPGAGVLHIFISNGAAGFQSPLQIQAEAQTRTNLNINRFNRSAGQTVTIPFLNLRDVNADGRADLVSRTEQRLDVFLASSAGDYFPARPSYSLDIAAIEAGLGEFDVDNLDFSNLTGVLALTHEEILEDANNDGIEDLLLREGGKVSLFIGQPDGMNLEQPHQVLRSSGNVLSTFLYDENEDGLKDLWLWRVEPISVGDLFVWLALSGSIGIEAFIYPNDGERFARRPARRITIDLRFPSVLRLANAYQSLNAEAEQLSSDSLPPTALASVDALIERQDLLVLADNQLRIFLNSIEPDNEEERFLGPLDYSRERDNYTFDIRALIERVNVQSNPQLARVEGRQADAVIALDTVINQGDVVSARLNDDDIDDVLVFTDYDGSHIRGLLLLSD